MDSSVAVSADTFAEIIHHLEADGRDSAQNLHKKLINHLRPTLANVREPQRYIGRVGTTATGKWFIYLGPATNKDGYTVHRYLPTRGDLKVYVLRDATTAHLRLDVPPMWDTRGVPATVPTAPQESGGDMNKASKTQPQPTANAGDQGQSSTDEKGSPAEGDTQKSAPAEPADTKGAEAKTAPSTDTSTTSTASAHQSANPGANTSTGDMKREASTVQSRTGEETK